MNIPISDKRRKKGATEGPFPYKHDERVPYLFKFLSFIETNIHDPPKVNKPITF